MDGCGRHLLLVPPLSSLLWVLVCCFSIAVGSDAPASCRHALSNGSGEGATRRLRWVHPDPYHSNRFDQLCRSLWSTPFFSHAPLISVPIMLVTVISEALFKENLFWLSLSLLLSHEQHYGWRENIIPFSVNMYNRLTRRNCYRILHAWDIHKTKAQPQVLLYNSLKPICRIRVCLLWCSLIYYSRFGKQSVVRACNIDWWVSDDPRGLYINVQSRTLCGGIVAYALAQYLSISMKMIEIPMRMVTW